MLGKTRHTWFSLHSGHHNRMVVYPLTTTIIQDTRKGIKEITVKPPTTITIWEIDSNNRMVVDVVQMVEVMARILGVEVPDSSLGTNGTKKTGTRHHHHTHHMD